MKCIIHALMLAIDMPCVCVCVCLFALKTSLTAKEIVLAEFANVCCKAFWR